jgi:outer membrane protein assembly factor BamB
MWYTQIAFDGSRGRMAGLHQHVSATHVHTVFQIMHAGKRYVFSQRDLNAFGEEVGIDGARALAEKKLSEIKGDLEAKIDPADKPPILLPTIETFVVPRISLYATSERGMVHALDGETGQTRWTISVGSPRYPTTAAGANDEYVGVLNGSTMYVLKADDGSIVWSRMIIGAPGAGPALTDEYVYVPTVTGAVEVYYLEDPKRPSAVFRSFGRTLVQPVVSYNSVAWPTDTGKLYVGLAHEPGLRFRLEAKEAINSAPAFGMDDRVFAASLDGYVYCLDERRGNVLWRFTTGEPITHSPVALGDVVYAITDRGNMYAVGIADGLERWMTPGIEAYVAGNDQRLYVMDSRGSLTILNADSGSRVGSIATTGIDEPFMNVQTDRLILATSTGLIQCLRPSNLRWPVVMNADEAEKPQGVKTPTKTPPPAEAEPMPPAGGEADPFAAPAGDDPAPMPADAAEPDPFATP